MLFSFGVLAFVMRNGSASLLIISAPFVWLLRRRWLLVGHLAMVACHVAVFLAVCLQTWIPPLGDHDIFITLAKRYSDFLIVPLDIIVLTWWSQSGELRFSMTMISAIVGLSTAVFAGAWCACSDWLQTIPPTIASRAGSVANSRPFCLVVGGRPAERLSQLAIGRLERAFSAGIEFYGYYALLKIDGEVVERNWSFRRGDFVAASQSFYVDCPAMRRAFIQR